MDCARPNKMAAENHRKIVILKCPEKAEQNTIMIDKIPPSTSSQANKILGSIFFELKVNFIAWKMALNQ